MQTIVNVMVDKQLYKYVGHIQEIAYKFLKIIHYIFSTTEYNERPYFFLV